MIVFTLDYDTGILTVTPKAPLEAADFSKIANQVDPYIETHGALKGILIYVESFPGWRDFSALLSQLRFIHDHHRKIKKLAAVTDSGFIDILQDVSEHFIEAEVRHFDYTEKEAAMKWLKA
jgi:hypothetical protein